MDALLVRNEFYAVWVLHCLLIYPAAFVSSILYHVLSHKHSLAGLVMQREII